MARSVYFKMKFNTIVRVDFSREAVWDLGRLIVPLLTKWGTPRNYTLDLIEADKIAARLHPDVAAFVARAEALRVCEGL